MGIDDRDYMRERNRDRHRREASDTVWNDKKARREHVHATHNKAVPLGSASWIGAGGGQGGWFEPINRGHDYQRGRYRRSPHTGVRVARLTFAFSLVLAGLTAVYGIKRGGWIPDFQSAIAFPESGSVTVSKRLSLERVTSHLTVVTDEANAVVQLIDPESGRHAMSVYVAAHDRVTVAVPRGTYRVQLVEGQKWHGPRSYFGPTTVYETVVELMNFQPRGGIGIDLHRRPDGNLKTRLMITDPVPL